MRDSHPVRADTKKRKNATQMLRATKEQEWWADQVVQVMLKGMRALDAAMLEMVEAGEAGATRLVDTAEDVF